MQSYIEAGSGGGVRNWLNCWSLSLRAQEMASRPKGAGGVLLGPSHVARVHLFVEELLP